MATIVTYTASMRTRKTDSASNYLNSAASQEYYRSGEEYVGIVHFADLNLSGKVITNMVLTVTSAKAGFGASISKTVYVRKSAYQAASQSGITGLNYVGDALGTFTGSFFGNTMSYTFNSTTNSSLFSALATYFQSGTSLAPNNTITLYNPNPPSSNMGYSQNYLQWNAATLEITYEEGVSEPTTNKTTADLNTAITINTNRLPESNAVHTLRYSFGALTNQLIAENVTLSHSWTPPITLAAQIPNATSGVCTISCETFINSTSVGTKTCTITLTVPTSVVPTISSVICVEAVSGIYDTFRFFVRTKSKLEVTIDAVGAKFGNTFLSAISSYRATINGATYTAASFTTGFLNTAGTNRLSVVVTDTRGRTASFTRDIDVADYNPPSISQFSAERCNSAGTTPQIDGTNIRVNITGALSSVNPTQHISCFVYYKLSTMSAWTQATAVPIHMPSQASPDYSVNETNLLLSGHTFNALSSYDLKVSLTDYFTTVEQVVSVGTKQVMMDFLSSGDGIAFGKIAERANKAEFGWPLKLSTPLAISEGGTGSTTGPDACDAIGALRKAGGQMNQAAQITKNSAGTTTRIQARDKAFIRTLVSPASQSGVYPIASIKTMTGDWSICAYRDMMAFVFGTDTNYDANINTTNMYTLDSSGSFTGNAANVTGTVAVAHGGTGATTVAGARDALGLGNTSGALPVANGGTGATTALTALANLGIAIKTGTILVGTGGATVTFDVPFDSVPYVLTTGSNNGAVSIYTVDVNGFTIRSSVNQNNVRWLALTFPTN